MLDYYNASPSLLPSNPMFWRFHPNGSIVIVGHIIYMCVGNIRCFEDEICRLDAITATS